MINNDPMTMTDEEMITELLDVVRVVRQHDSMKLSLAEVTWALRQYRRAEILIFMNRNSDDVTLYSEAVKQFAAMYPNWPEEAK